MVEKCPARYKNLNLIQSFSEQGYATIQLMKQACMNDEWLRQRVLKLNYLTPPAVRKWYMRGEWIDSDKSYGYSINNNGEVIFNSVVEERIYIDFIDDDNLIDLDKSDVSIVSFDTSTGNVTNILTETDITSTDDEIELTTTEEDEDYDYDVDGNRIQYSLDDENNEIIREDLKEADTEIESSIVYRCQLPYETEAEKKTYTTIGKTIKQDAVYNTTTGTIGTASPTNAWYIAFDKSQDYYVTPDWVSDWKDPEIPSVVRGQTFKATATGKLESVDLILDYNGGRFNDTSSPLYIQIWKTHKASRVKTYWDKTEKKMKKKYKRNQQNKGTHNLVNGKYKEVKKGTGQYELVYEKVYVPTTKFKTSYTDWSGKKKSFDACSIYKPLGQGVFNYKVIKPLHLIR